MTRCGGLEHRRTLGRLAPGIELFPMPFTPWLLTAGIREILDRAS
jgi:hypothetical protein